MKHLIRIVFVILLTTHGLSVADEGKLNEDTRTNLGLIGAEKSEFLKEMRQMLVSIQGIITGIGENNRALIIQSARHSGNQMMREMPDAIRQKLPQSFKEKGKPTHMAFEELIVHAETDDMDMLTSLTGKLMQKCTDCHAMFRAD